MAKIKATPELLQAILERVPEGVIHKSNLQSRISGDLQLDADGIVGREGSYFYDKTRLSSEQAREYSQWSRAALPAIKKDGRLTDPPIIQQRQDREQQLRRLGTDYLRLLHILDATPGYAPAADLVENPGDETVLQNMLVSQFLRHTRDMIYDPLRLSPGSAKEIYRRNVMAALLQDATEFLQAKPGHTASVDSMIEKFGRDHIEELLALREFSTFTVRISPQLSERWVRLSESDHNAALAAAQEATKITDEMWQPAAEAAGNVIRPGAKSGKSWHMKAVAHSYTVKAAAKRLEVRVSSVESAIAKNHLKSFIDPERRVRIPAYEVEDAFENPARGELVTGFEKVRLRDLAIVANVGTSTMRSRLMKAGLNRVEPLWGQVRGRWNLPTTWAEYRETLHERAEEWHAERMRKRMEREREIDEEIQREREQRDELRARLVAAFPTWRHEGRIDQNIVLHVGPPNSGKTHDALNVLAEAGSGWYLAPLRLLAFEIFDRLNARGVLCNLLTGEEYIPIPGATITAATVEMFNPNASGECIIIDEAQMLADADRGWAWTRALMQSQSPQIHVISPASARHMVEQLASSAAIPLTVVEHERLTPIKVAEKHWPLHQLPPRTILVAFSRRTVLYLKTELERAKRTVSVVYGNLPPEVRRKQADRFANGETDICVATDAVGMGLNLPADNVCFFEVEKFDGHVVRTLRPSEVQQIGGRAGRFGLSTAGEVGATSKMNLSVIQKLFHAPIEPLTHARVAPSVEDLELLPGSLADRLAQWGELESIPESLRAAIKTADMTERIELARMLSDYEVNLLGLANALKLVNAPTRESTRDYWRECTTAILAEQPMPLPPLAPQEIRDTADLEITETCVSGADIYLWLAQRREFSMYGPDEEEVREMRAHWSNNIDQALLRRLESGRVCAQCGRKLHWNHRYSICDNCYRMRYDYY